jgi:hypothetical protein
VKGAAGAVLLVVLLAAAGEGAAVATRPRRTGAGHDPERYAREKLPALQRRYDNATVRGAVERFGPARWGAIPTTMLLGFSASSVGPYEQGGPPDYVRGELGLERYWRAAHAGDATTRAELGRAVADVDADQWFRDREGQWYLGLRRYRQAYDGARRVLAAGPAGVALPERPSSPWDARMAVTTYSSGAGVLPTLAARLHWPLLTSEDAAWRHLAEVIADAADRGDATLHGVPLRGKWKAAHAILRADQRVASGRMLAESRAPREVEWYPRPLPEGLRARLARHASGL